MIQADTLPFRAALYLTLVAGMAATVWGLWGLQWPAALPFQGDALTRLAGVLIVSAALGYLGDRVWHIGPFLSLGLAFVAVCAATGQPWVVVTVLWAVFASIALGGVALDALDVHGDNRGPVLDGLIGAGIYGVAVYPLAWLGLAYPGVYAGLLSLPLALRWRSVFGIVVAAKVDIERRRYGSSPTLCLEVAIAAVAGVHLMVALLPELGIDALAMHLFISSQLSVHNAWDFDVTAYVWAAMPLLVDWIYSYGYLLAGESAARLINVVFILLVAQMVHQLARWAGASPAAALWVALLFLSMPLTFAVSSSLFVESVWSAFLVGGLLVLARAATRPEGSRSDLPLAGLLLGMGLAAKAVTIALLPAYLLFVAPRARRLLWPPGAQRVPLALVLFLALGAIPYAIAYWKTGNPVFPFFNGVFRSPFWPPSNFESASIFGKGLTAEFFYAATFQSERFIEGTSGTVGFQWVALLPASLAFLVLGWRKRGLALALFAVAGIAAAFQSVSYLRYVFPCFVVLFAALAAGAPAGRPGAAWAIVAAGVTGLNVLFLSAAAQYRDFPLSPLQSHADRDAYLADRIPERRAVAAINGVNTFASPVAFFAHPYGAGLNSAAVYANWYNHSFFDDVTSSRTVDDLAFALSNQGVELVILNEQWGKGGTWGTPQSQALILEATEPVAAVGTVQVRRVHPRLRFASELLKAPDFGDREAWTFTGDASWSPGQASVDGVSSALQTVPVQPGRRYLYQADVSCPDTAGQARLQVAWHDPDMKVLAVRIRVVECGAELQDYDMDLRAPDDAAYATVYATGHTQQPVVFSRSSLSQ
jgi:hypothetical protein